MDVPGRCLLISYTLHMIVAGQGGQGGSDRTALGLSLNPNSKSGERCRRWIHHRFWFWVSLAFHHSGTNTSPNLDDRRCQTVLGQ